MGFRRDGSRRDYSRRHLTPSLGVHDMAIDLGTANTLVYVGGRGIVVSEPSVVASDVDTGLVHAVGADAERMIGRTPATIAATRPLRHGVIADFEVNEAIAHYLRGAHQLAIGSRTAESIKISLGSAMPLEPEETAEVRGRHLVTGLPTAIELRSEEVRAAVAHPVREILQAIRDTLEETPPELSSDIARHGILLAGGGTPVRGFPELVAAETGMPVYLAESPLTCVVYGSGQALDQLDQLSRVSRHKRPSLTTDWRTA